MIEQTLLLKLSSPGITDDTTSRLRQEYQAYQSLFHVQPTLVQQYLGVQAATLAEAITVGASQAHFMLPDVVAYEQTNEGSTQELSVPAASREQFVGGWLARLTRTELRSALSQRLSELERSLNRGVSAGAGLLRYTIAYHMIYNMLPVGRSVIYCSPETDDIPNVPVEADPVPGLAVKSTVVTSRGSHMEPDRVDLSAPYVEAARRFYLPQWVAFDDQGQLLLGSLSEAEAHIKSMQHYLAILQSAVAIAPYMIADEVWQQKRYGMLGQLVNQGRALANFQSREIIPKIQRRMTEHKLDRGLGLSLPYFDDQKLSVEMFDFMVIPSGWVMFVPAFVTLAAREQQLKVAGNTRLSFATRKHLITELHALELAFTR